MKNNKIRIVLGLLFAVFSLQLQAGIVTAEHKVLSAVDSFAGKSQLALAITLTNHGGKDLSYAHFHLQNVNQLDLLTRYMPLKLRTLPGGQRITVEWQVEAIGNAKQWMNGKSMVLVGQAVGEDGTMVPLKIISEP
ncbi:MAG: hypothetical protein OEZ58_13460 [Gammaproteobacteria bacterium]|nr:hypothetical protein [Gammaproteobacteria bacterium]MDH5729995.1 hypothetical protein [Gammaproteobacteria bacterium]